MKDTIYRHAAVDVCLLKEWIENWFTKNRFYHLYAKNNNIPITELYDILEQMPPAQTEITDEQAIEHLQSTGWMQNHDREMYDIGLKKQLADDSGSYDSLLPSAQPTLYGYDIRYLELIASVLQEEGLPPERVKEALTDIGRIVAIVADEFEESLRKAFSHE